MKYLNYLFILTIIVIFTNCSSDTSGVDPSTRCKDNQYYDATYSETCVDLCVNEGEGLSYDSDKEMLTCQTCEEDNQYISSDGLCITCSDNQIKVTDDLGNTTCQDIQTCTSNTHCTLPTVCHYTQGYCVNCILDSDCGTGYYCTDNNTCEIKNVYSQECTSNNECFTGKCAPSGVCGCLSDGNCEYLNNTIGIEGLTCDNSWDNSSFLCE